MIPRALTLLVAGSLVLAACGDESDDTAATTASTPAATEPAATEPAGTEAPAATEAAETTTATADCEADGVTISVANVQTGDLAVQAAKAVLEERYPGLTVATGTAPAFYDELTQQVVADLAAGREVDVVMAGNNQLRFWVDTYSPQPFDTAALAPTYDQDYLSIGTVDGTVYMAPFQVSIPFLYYNKDVIAAAGGDPESPPETYTELFELAKQVTGSTGFESFYASKFDWIIQAGVQSAGGELLDDAGMPAFDTDEGVAGMAIYSTPAADGTFFPSSDKEVVPAFISGQLPLLVTSMSQTAKVAEGIGDSFEWGVVPMPVPDTGEARFPAGGNGWLVLTDDECKAMFSNELIATMLSPEILAESLRVSAYIPVDTAARDELLADDTLGEQQRYGYGLDVDVTPWGGWQGSSAPEANQILADLADQLVQGQDPAEAIATAAAAISEVVGS